MLVIPAGYMILEYVISGPLCYGLRKSFFTPDDKEGYKKGKDMLAGAGRDVTKMEEILQQDAELGIDPSWYRKSGH